MDRQTDKQTDGQTDSLNFTKEEGTDRPRERILKVNVYLHNCFYLWEVRVQRSEVRYGSGV